MNTLIRQTQRPLMQSLCLLNSTRPYTRARASKNTQKTDKKEAHQPNASQSNLLPDQILVGRPDPISNIRPIRLYIPEDETPQEKKYRTMREDAYKRDHEFWVDNNSRFEQGKVAFEREMVEKNGECTLDDLSVYYKQYQVDSYQRHLAYNKYLWSRNIAMIVPAIRAWFESARRRKSRGTAGVARYSIRGYFDEDASVPHIRSGDKGAHPRDSDPGSSGTASNGSGQNSGDDRINRRAEKIRSYY